MSDEVQALLAAEDEAAAAEAQPVAKGPEPPQKGAAQSPPAVSQGSPAADEAASAKAEAVAQEIKVVISVTPTRAIIGVQRLDTDPEIRVVRDLPEPLQEGLRAVLAMVPDIVRAAEERWATQPKGKVYKAPERTVAKKEMPPKGAAPAKKFTRENAGVPAKGVKPADKQMDMM